VKENGNSLSQDTKTYWKRRALKAETEAQTWRRIRAVDNSMVLAGGTTAFGWPIAPVGRKEWDRYIDYTRATP